MTERKRKISGQPTAGAGFPETGVNREAAERALRLKQAVQSAGGNKAVSEKSGIPLATLGDYLAGGEWKLSRVIALADACGVSVEWLATGRGATRPEQSAPPTPPVGPVETPAPAAADDNLPPLTEAQELALMQALNAVALLSTEKPQPNGLEMWIKQRSYYRLMTATPGGPVARAEALQGAFWKERFESPERKEE
jgi:hypothetical protein